MKGFIFLDFVQEENNTSLTVKESPSAAMTLTSAALTYSTGTEDKQGNSQNKDKQTHEADTGSDHLFLRWNSITINIT